ALVAIVVGVWMISDWWLPGHRTVGIALAIGGASAIALLVSLYLPLTPFPFVLIVFPFVDSVSGPLETLFRSLGVLETDATADNARNERTTLTRRRAAKKEAQSIASRIRNVEELTTSSEGGVDAKHVSIKRARSRKLSQLPLTEADLVGELEKLIALLHNCRYGIVIGIDE